MKIHMDRSWIEVDLDNLAYNVKAIRAIMHKETRFMAVVKADAYGHGAVSVANALNQLGVFSFAVATIEEAIALREADIQGEILVLGFTSPSRAKDLFYYDVMQTVVDYEYAKALQSTGMKIKVHIKIDTGMHRLGNNYQDIEHIKQIFNYKSLQAEGIFTHLCVSDSLSLEDKMYTKQQIHHFYELLEMLKKEGIQIPKTHIQSSYGVLNYPQLKCDYARIGIAMYGTLSSLQDSTVCQITLKPVLSIKSHIALIKRVEKNASIGYGRAHISLKNSRIAIVPIGYADGLPRNITDYPMYVLIQGMKAPIIGRICMDQMMVDISKIPNACCNDVVTIIGQDHQQKITPLEIAEASDTITNEVLSRIGNRLPKIYIKEKQYVS